MNSKEKSLPGLLRLPEFKLGTIYFFLFLLTIAPYYNWFYRNIVNFLMSMSIIISLPIIIFIFFRYLFRLDLHKALLSIALVVIILWTGINAQEWRYAITEKVINIFYCNLNSQLNKEYILGGISEMVVGGDIRRTGAFQNSSHCLIVSCMEEFFYCED